MKKLYKIQLFIFFSLFITTLIKSQCTAGFNLTQNAGGNVTFTSTSTGTNTSTYYQWNWGDATNANGSGLTNMSHTYPTNGNYTITLTITNFSLCTSTATQVISVTNSPCTVAINSSFTFTNTTGGNVNFTSTSTGTNVSSTYLWNFGDGNTSTTMNPSHTYTSNGNFFTSLSVANGACSDSSWANVPVSTVPCSLTPSFTSSTTTSGQTYFVSTSTGTVAGTTYQWNFGDATFGTGNPVYHSYAVNGTYTVTLVLTNPSSTISTCSATITNTVVVSTSPCSLTINASFTYTNTSAANFNFTSTSTGTTASSTYTWNFGDGNTSTVMNPSHTYTTNGNFPVSLLVQDGACSDNAVTSVSVSSLPCIIVPSFTTSTTSSGQIYFVSTSTGTNSSSTYSWNFGDATTGFGNPIYHGYAVNGTYSVTLVVNNSFTPTAACSATITQTVVVTTAPCTTSINASFTYTNLGGGNVNFTSTSTGTNAGTTYNWSFGDSNTSTVMNPSHTYGANGNYFVGLTIANGTCTDTTAASVLISGMPCAIVPSFTFSNTSSGQLYFTSTSTGVSPGASYYWDFGDASFGFTNPIYHTYASNGIYSVSLVITNPGTLTPCSATVTIPVTVTTTSCVPNPSFYLAKSTSTTTNLWFAYPTYPANITNAVWSWGDATSSTGLYPSHIYASTGWYNICLTITVSCSATGSTCVMSNIYRMQAQSGAAGIAQINVINSSIGITEFSSENSNFNLFPNPNNGSFEFEIKGLEKSTKQIEITVYNMLGEIIYVQIENTPTTDLIKTINLPNISSGAYFIRISDGNRSYSKKMIINR